MASFAREARSVGPGAGFRPPIGSVAVAPARFESAAPIRGPGRDGYPRAMGAFVEREFKLRIPDEPSFAALLERLGARGAVPVRQVNHFFDTAARDLRSARIALRLRAEDGSWTLGLKGPESGPSGGAGAFAERPEEELEVDSIEAEAVLAGTRCPLAALEAGLGAEPLVTAARRRAGDAPLLHLGSFENERTRVGPRALPGDPEGPRLVVELDRVRFPDGAVERELELEVPAGGDANATWSALERLFSSVGIAPESVPSKAARFFRILDRRV